MYIQLKQQAHDPTQEKIVSQRLRFKYILIPRFQVVSHIPVCLRSQMQQGCCWNGDSKKE
jgi:hypothetical protein